MEVLNWETLKVLSKRPLKIPSLFWFLNVKFRQKWNQSIKEHHPSNHTDTAEVKKKLRGRTILIKGHSRKEVLPAQALGRSFLWNQMNRPYINRKSLVFFYHYTLQILFNGVFSQLPISDCNLLPRICGSLPCRRRVHRQWLFWRGLTEVADLHSLWRCFTIQSLFRSRKGWLQIQSKCGRISQTRICIAPRGTPIATPTSTTTS